MTARDNLVDYPPSGLVVAIQYWHGDEAAAMRLARLLADIEPIRRDDVTLMFVRRQDVEESEDLHRTYMHCAQKFLVSKMRTPLPGVGHPAGANALWAGTFQTLFEKWQGGTLRSHSVFFCEADGCPLRADWLDRLLDEHAKTIAAGKRVTGAEMNEGTRHVNGSLIAHLSLWGSQPSLHVTPQRQAWDLFHAAVLMAEARPTRYMLNLYGAGRWSPESLEVLAREAVWLSSSKDDSVVERAEKVLVSR